ncbi:hypothetical protein E0H73_32520 [Kribbella pittospori]|uniref:Uncharacterized protein n=1 Tax=Kribbella pittospori TaxID=722689 RepID=A0A4R0K8A9_9ACTN|nr:hypothetical protein [Kribbella pittospori]TCC56413.1 hypothetical protein E0H73_32520 [Kribbella pittospori]
MQLAVRLALAVSFAGLTAWLLVLRLWPAAAIWAVPTCGLATRVIVLIRLDRMGFFAAEDADRPSNAEANRQTSAVFMVQFVGWILVGVYSAATGFWMGLVLAVILAYISIAVFRMLRRRQPAGSMAAGPSSPDP